MRSKTIVYCAGPSFCPEEEKSMAGIAAILEASGYEVYLPERDGLERPLRDYPPGEAAGMLALREAVFTLEIFQVAVRCGGLVLNMNGRVPDEGSVFKASLAFSVGKPVVLYKRDHRSPFHGNDNSMILGLSPPFAAVNRIEKIPRALSKAVRKINRYGEPGPPGRPQYFNEVLQRGAELWAALEEKGRERLIAELTAPS